jgi:hypothetical protein
LTPRRRALVAASERAHERRDPENSDVGCMLEHFCVPRRRAHTQ